MNEYLKLIITSPDGKQEWQQKALAIPPIGSSITCRGDDGKIRFEGVVDAVHIGIRYHRNLLCGESVGREMAAPGMVVSVWLREYPPMTPEHPDYDYTEEAIDNA